MATSRAKESCGLGKERKITAPSSVTIPNVNTSTKRTPKSSPRGISTDQKLSSFPSSPSSSSSSSTHSLSILPQKHVPNYLKSTASSRHDHNFKPIKKSAGPTPIPEGKPSLNRRRSFDKPPPATQRLGKPFRSPEPRNRAAHAPVRSSSFGAKPSTTIVSSTKTGFLERSGSKIYKVGGKTQQSVQTLKSSSNVRKSLKRESSNAASASSAEMVPKTKNAVEHVGQSPVLVLGANEEDLKKIECELDLCLPDPRPELDKELSTTDQVEKRLHHHQPIQDTKIFKVVGSNKKVEETPGAAETDNAKSSIREDENREQNEGEGEEEAKEEEKPERIEVEKEEVFGVVASEESTNNKNEEEKSHTDPIQVGVIVLEHKEVEDGQSSKEENHNSTEKEAEATEKVAAAAAAAAEAAAAKPRQGGPGRKESPAVYNHVIEETASKLLEKRKNKVRALAGAFQTVIDYESSSK